jgi:hypothetical protein
MERERDGESERYGEREVNVDQSIDQSYKLPSLSHIFLTEDSSPLDNDSKSLTIEIEIEKECERKMICNDALIWLESFADDTLPGCVFSSLPDISEVPDIAKGFKEADRYAAYKTWFTDAAALIMRKMKPMSYAIFLQSDIRVILGMSQTTEWIDKSHFLSTAADREGCTLMWHKIVLLQPGAMGRQGLGRPMFSHLLCYGKGPVTYRR